MTHQVINMNAEFEESNHQIRTKESRTIKLYLIKYKCALIVSCMIVFAFTFFILFFDKLNSRELTSSSLHKIIEKINNGTRSIDDNSLSIII